MAPHGADSFQNISLINVVTSGQDRRAGLTRTSVTLRQATSAVTCSYSLNPNSGNFRAEGWGRLDIVVTVPASCSWSVSGLPSWTTVSGKSSGTGSGTLVLSIAANSGAARSATFTVSGNVIYSEPGGCHADVQLFAQNPNSGSFPAAGGTLDIALTIPSSCAWSVFRFAVLGYGLR